MSDVAAVATLAVALLGMAGGFRPFPATDAAIGAEPPQAAAAAEQQGAPAKDVFDDPLPPGATARLGTLRWRQAVPPSFLGFSPDGKIAVTAGRDGSARLWDVRSQKVLSTLRHDKAINDARFDRSGRRLVTGSDDGTAAVWRVSDGKRLATLKGHTSGVVAAAFSPDGRHVATASGRCRL